VLSVTPWELEYPRHEPNAPLLAVIQAFYR
jgi:hypothetical protein